MSYKLNLKILVTQVNGIGSDEIQSKEKSPNFIFNIMKNYVFCLPETRMDFKLQNAIQRILFN